MNVAAYYINLRSADKRRLLVEQSFHDAQFSHSWSLNRFEAVNTKDRRVQENLTALRKPLIATYLSHLDCMHVGMHLSKMHVLIAEDDVCFSSRTESIVNQSIENLSSQDWDILFTDICITGPKEMIDFFSIRRMLIEKNEFRLFNLKSMNFCGATCYIINADSREKVFHYFSKIDPLDTPIDLTMRTLVHSGALNAFVIFPYPTSLSEQANVTQLQQDDELTTNLLWNTFRQLVWVNGEPSSVIQDLASIPDNYFDEEGEAFGKILQGLLSKNFHPV